MRLLAALLLLCAFTAVSCGGAGSGESVTVLGSWTGAEGDAFHKVLAGFEKSTGIHVDYTGTRDARAILASELHDGTPPDTAVLATPGDLRTYAAGGELKPVGGAQEGIGGDLTAATGPDGAVRPYGIVVKAAVKGLIWFAPRSLPAATRARLAQPVGSVDDLLRIASGAAPKPWCLGLEDTSNSGWPGTDWIEDVVLHEFGPEKYDAWVSGRLEWESPPVRKAWETFGSVVAGTRSGTDAILLTGYGKAGAPMFANPPGCLFDHQASFITGFYRQVSTHLEPGADYDFVPFPGGQAMEIGGDLLGMFRSTPAARKLVAYLTTAEAQKTWVGEKGGGAYSLNRSVPPSAYPDALSRRIAQALASAKTVRFDASDSMPTVMAAAFDHAVLEYVTDPTSQRLDRILRSLDKVRCTTGSGSAQLPGC
ncbi:ABC transporter substrate-binding protein [Actinomadura verrucosospora]|uniref:Family 1 extracellular solute-binding protein n=1 Tax=Actinomadura verrucosospora TaxID=46165 RepID=A0A7D3W0Z2_ACTVE|nr:ABC transporter substrate-binding protein [Actinomadura verrucosospora]QKG26939.1 family 1 extracellular solute-binding protein [Actinomadura verrucosospora]